MSSRPPISDRESPARQRSTGRAGAPAFFGRLMQSPPHLLLLAIVMIGMIIRAPLLSRTSLWFDEAASWDQSRGTLGELISSVAADNYPPLHNLLLWVFIHGFGEAEYVLRLPSLLAGILSIWLAYKVGEALTDKGVGLATALILACSPMEIWFSGEARMYTLFSATGLLFLLATLRALACPAPGAALWSALATALFLHTHIYATFGVAGAGLGLAFMALLDPAGRRGILRLLLALIAGGALYLPWGIILLGRARSVVHDGFWIAEPNWRVIQAIAIHLGGSKEAILLLLGFAALSFIALVRPQAKSDEGEPSAQAQKPLWPAALPLLLGYTLLPPLAGYLASISLRPILYDRYLIATLPGLVLLACLGARALLPRGGPLLLSALLLTVTIPTMTETVLERRKPEFRDLARQYLAVIESSTDASAAAQSNPVYASNRETALPFSYYVQDVTSVHYLKGVIPPGLELPARFWLVLSHVNQQEHDALLASVPAPYRRTFESSGWGYGHGGVTLIRFERRD